MTDELDLSERVRFYLEHHAQIEEWHKLGYEARAATSELLKTVRVDVESVASEAGLDVRALDAGQANKYEMVYVERPGTPMVAGLVPAVGICFAWNPSWVVLDHDTYAPFVAVRVDRHRVDHWQDLRGRFLELTRARREELRLRHEPEWPIWTRVRAGERWWEDFDAYRALVRDAVDLFIREFQPAVDQVIGLQ